MQIFLQPLLGAAAAAVVVLTSPAAAGPVPPQPHTHRALESHVINLDLAPEDRYTSMIGQYNDTIWEYWLTAFANNDTRRSVLFDLVDVRGPELDELQREIVGLQRATKLPLKFIQGVQFIYEVGTLMVPEINKTAVVDAVPVPARWRALKDMPWTAPGCTGIVATNSQDGTVNHARNQDLGPVPILRDLVYNGVFQKGGKEVFRSEMVAGYCLPITIAKFGADGFSIERNTRYSDHDGGNVEMLHNLLVEKRALNGWQLRQIAIHNETFDEAAAAVAAADYVSTEYTIMSGVKKGAIFSRNPSNVAFTQTLGKHNFDEPDDYIIMTNFDFFFGDEREVFDASGGHTGHPTRREVAQEILNASVPTGLTPELLWDTINAQGVIADTIYQSLINIETGVWNTSQPNFS